MLKYIKTRIKQMEQINTVSSLRLQSHRRELRMNLGLTVKHMIACENYIAAAGRNRRDAQRRDVCVCVCVSVCVCVCGLLTEGNSKPGINSGWWRASVHRTQGMHYGGTQKACNYKLHAGETHTHTHTHTACTRLRVLQSTCFKNNTNKGKSQNIGYTFTVYHYIWHHAFCNAKNYIYIYNINQIFSYVSFKHQLFLQCFTNHK